MKSGIVCFSKKKCLITAFFSALALFIELETKEPYESHIYNRILNAVFELFEQAADMFASSGFKILVTGITLFLLYYAVFGDSNSKIRTIAIKGELLDSTIPYRVFGLQSSTS